MRDFLSKHNFNVPQGKGFNDYVEAYEYYKSLDSIVMVKPVDSSGGKGVIKVTKESEFKDAFDIAMSFSILITDAIKEASDVDLAEYTIKSAVVISCDDLKEQKVKQYVASYVIHSLQDGIYEGLWINDEIKDDIIQMDMFINVGDEIKRFENGGCGIGAALIKFDTIEEMNYSMDNMEKYIKVKTAL